MDLTLEQLLASLSTGLDKSASDKEDEGKKDEKEDDKPAFLKEKGEKKDESKDDEESEKDEGQTKEASAQGAALAREIMEKVAGLNLESVTGMNKTASSAGKTLAQALIQKLASAGDMNTEDGVFEGATPNKVQVDNAQMHAEGASYVKPMLTSDGLRPTGSINEIFDAIVQDALSQGAASTDQVHSTGVSAQEGAVEDHALPNQVKAAAMNELLEQGFDFDQAAEMVKSAEDHMLKGWVSPAWQEHAIARDHGKEGIQSFGDAVSKQIGGTYRANARSGLHGMAGLVGGAILGGAAGATRGVMKGVNKSTMKNLVSVGSLLGGGTGMIGGSLHGTQKSLRNQAKEHHQKYAAMNELLEQGFDFDQAAEMIKQASAELEDQFEKAAAVDHLVDNGIDFENAVELVKQASEEIEAEEFGMAKVAAMNELLGEGFDFDDALEMIKQASAGDMNTEDGVFEGATPNKVQVDNAQMHAEGASYVKPMLTSDGLRPTGTINEIFDAVIQDALSQGAASTDQVHEVGVSDQEGEVEDHALPNQIKTAAMNELLEQGFDFDQAAEMVKEAGRVDAAKAAISNLAGKAAYQGRKARAIGELYANEAKESIRGAAGKVKGLAGSASGKAKVMAGNLAHDARLLGANADIKARELGRGAKAIGGKAVDYAKANPYKVAGGVAAGLAAGSAGAYALSEKKASVMAELLDQGVDFDQAADFVKEAGRATEAIAAGKGMANAAIGKVKGFAGSASGKAKVMAGNLAHDARLLGANADIKARELGRGAKAIGGKAVDYAKANPYKVAGGVAAGLAAGSAGAYALSEKKAEAMSILLEQGVDFDQAAELVKQASAKLGV